MPLPSAETVSSSMPDTRQDADLRIWIPAHWPDARRGPGQRPGPKRARANLHERAGLGYSDDRSSIDRPVFKMYREPAGQVGARLSNVDERHNSALSHRSRERARFR